MRIDRSRSRQIFRRRARGTGCLPWIVTLSVLLFTLWLGRHNIVDTLLSSEPQTATLSDALTMYQAGDLDSAISTAQTLYASDPQRDDALILLVRALIYRSYADVNQEADRAQALSLTQAAVERSPYNMQVLGIHSLALQTNGQAEDAQRVALRVIRNDENNISARIALSLSYASQGIFEAALRNSLRAVMIANSSAPTWRADAYRVVALAHSNLGNYTDAAQTVEIAITHNRRLLALHFERALYAQQVGDLDTATAYYFNVIAFDEDNIKARVRLCDVSSSLGERDAAVDWCSAVTQLAPGWSEGWYWLGREYYLDGDWRNTQISLNRCSTLQVAQSVPITERRFECWYLQGQAAEVLGDCPSLLALYGDYRVMAASASLPQTWVYPNDMPAICATPTVIISTPSD